MLLDLVVAHQEGSVGNVKTGDSRGCSDHEDDGVQDPAWKK